MTATAHLRAASAARSQSDVLVEDLLGWYALNARDLPWRRSGIPAWHVLVSEIMLQQTPVARVLPTYRAWLERWPTPADLAAETPGEVVRMWGKLGYPRRALRLHACAVAITRDHAGLVPDDLDLLLALPGVGSYTARAVLAFAHHRRAAVVDTNVRRVLARAVAGQAQAGPVSTARDLAAMTAVLPMDEIRAATFCAAVMELGAVLCRAQSPACGPCPVAQTCRWRAAGYPAWQGSKAPRQQFAGTDRQVRGLLLDVLRASRIPVAQGALDVAWPEPKQRDRALAGLLVDGLVQQTAAGEFCLPT